MKFLLKSYRVSTLSALSPFGFTHTVDVFKSQSQRTSETLRFESVRCKRSSMREQWSFDVLAHVPYALPTLTERRAKKRSGNQHALQQQAAVFLDFVLSHYVSVAWRNSNRRSSRRSSAEISQLHRRRRGWLGSRTRSASIAASRSTSTRRRCVNTQNEKLTNWSHWIFIDGLNPTKCYKTTLLRIRRIHLFD